MRLSGCKCAHAVRDDLENRQIFQIPEVARAGGLDALKVLGRPADFLRDTKGTMFAS